MSQKVIGRSILFLIKVAIAGFFLWFSCQIILVFNNLTEIQSYTMVTLAPDGYTSLELFVIRTLAFSPLLLAMFVVFKKDKIALLFSYCLVVFYFLTTYFQFVAVSFIVDEAKSDLHFDVYLRSVLMALLWIVSLFHFLFVRKYTQPVLKMLPVFCVIWAYTDYIHLGIVQNIGFLNEMSFEEYLQFFHAQYIKESDQDLYSQASTEQWVWFYLSMAAPFILFLLSYYSTQIFSYIESLSDRLTFLAKA